MTIAVSARGISLNYGKTQALKDVDLSLTGPAIYGLLGRNGSGKTSLMSVLAGFRLPGAGEVTMDGAPVFETAETLARICLIRESGDTVYQSETIEVALNFARAMRPYWDHDFARALLDRFKLSKASKISTLSRGQRAALACTLGLASRAPLTMFDETYLGMDAPSRYAFYDALLKDYMDHPRLIVLSTHLIEEVSDLFEKVIILDDGRLTHSENAEDLRARGVTLTGPADAVDRIALGFDVLNEKSLGPTKSVAVLAGTDNAFQRSAAAEGVEVGALRLQDLFVHLTAASDGKEADHGQK